MKNLYYLMLLGLVVLALTGCTDDDNVEEETGGAEGNGADSEETGGDLTVAIPSDVVSLDPHGSNDDPSEQLRDVVYEGLLTQDEDLEIVGQLAEEWEQVDELTWEFTLREDVTFHDGSEFNAEVVKANIDRIQDPAVLHPVSSCWRWSRMWK